jgi:hypothetical protein
MIKLMAISAAIASMPFSGQVFTSNNLAATQLVFTKSSPANVFLVTKKQQQLRIFPGCYKSATMRTYIK